MTITSIVCDCCGRDITERKQEHKLEVFAHIDGSIKMNERGSERIDGNDYPTSGRKKSYDLGLPCYNEIMYVAFDEFKKISTK